MLTWDEEVHAEDPDDEGDEWKRGTAEPISRPTAGHGEREPRAIDLLWGCDGPQAAGRYVDMRTRVLARWPLVCTRCRSEFRDPRPTTSGRRFVRCPKCRRAQRSDRSRPVSGGRGRS